MKKSNAIVKRAEHVDGFKVSRSFIAAAAPGVKQFFPPRSYVLKKKG